LSFLLALDVQHFDGEAVIHSFAMPAGRWADGDAPLLVQLGNDSNGMDSSSPTNRHLSARLVDVDTSQE
jgi:hypothetical protein